MHIKWSTGSLAGCATSKLTASAAAVGARNSVGAGHATFRYSSMRPLPRSAADGAHCVDVAYEYGTLGGGSWRAAHR